MPLCCCRCVTRPRARVGGLLGLVRDGPAGDERASVLRATHATLEVRTPDGARVTFTCAERADDLAAPRRILKARAGAKSSAEPRAEGAAEGLLSGVCVHVERDGVAIAAHDAALGGALGVVAEALVRMQV